MKIIKKKKQTTHQSQREYESLKNGFPQLLPPFEERLTVPHHNTQDVLQCAGRKVGALQ